jgi:xanthine dehydrogenase YagS FAD-binding subunit
LAQGELVVAVLLPVPIGGTQVYRKVRERASFTFANVSVALIADYEGRVARLALGGLAPKPWRVEAAEAGPADPDAIAEIVLTGARTTVHNGYKLALTARAIAAALSDARSLVDTQ